jgi:dipeptidyl aminopeptidase/acylaminoacyl peptidase
MTSHDYIVVAINFTGSTGYGQEFTDRIQNEWGGRPFLDLVAGLEYVKSAYPEIDAERVSMLGSSYGGFMANWFQGHNEQTNFKTIVCQNGVFNTTNCFYASDELYFAEREYGGTPWAEGNTYEK